MSAWSPVTDMTIIRNHYFDTLKKETIIATREKMLQATLCSVEKMSYIGLVVS